MTNDEYKAIPEEVIDLGETGIIELPKFNASNYIGKKFKVEKVTEHKGQYGFFVKFTTAPVEGEIRASRVIGLQIDINGKVGWGIGTKMAQFLSKYGVSHYRNMIGKEVIVQTVTGKDGTDYLTF